VAKPEEILAVLDVAGKLVRLRQDRRQVEPTDIVSWAEANFLIAEEDEVQGKPIKLEPHQKAILRYIFSPDRRFSTVIYSTPKKSGKTTIAAMVARWLAEIHGRFQEMYCVANDFDQAKNRAFAAASRSVELHSNYNVKTRLHPGQWRVLDREMIHLPSGSRIKALATDYKGEAGAEPTLTIWTELWGYIYEASLRFWVEMTPTPTRELSMRWVETYAGFEGESQLLEDLYKLGKEGKQLTAGELGDLSAFAEAPNHDSLVPCWVNERAGLFMYWDEGAKGRRMPWQRGEVGERYYREQEAILLPSQFRRLHLNEWAAGESEAIPIAWWDACQDPMVLQKQGKTPIVIGVDAAVSGDSTALVCVARHPEKHDDVVEFYTRVWYPPEGGKIDYSSTLVPELDRLIADYNVAEVAYDEYQLHHLVNEQRAKPKPAWFRPFGQQVERLVADKQLYDLVRDRRLHHSGNEELRRHIQGCKARILGDEENRMRFVKKSERAKIDAAVALSMASAECLRLNL